MSQSKRSNPERAARAGLLDSEPAAPGILQPEHATDRSAKRASSNFLGSEAMFGALLESVPDAIVIVDDRGVILLANHQTLKLFAYNRAVLE
jgi:PAS domain-containing protein